MRVAVMSDVHGFSLALDVVLAEIEREGPFDQVVVAGDLCEGGPAPDEALNRLRAATVTCIQGNTDRDIADGTRHSAAADWCRDRIGQAGIEYLAQLPFSVRIKPSPGAPETHDLLVVHANPTDLDRHMRPEMSDQELDELIGSTPANAIAFGHLHIPYIRRVGTRLLVDVSSVGNPKDGVLQCAWGVLTWDAESRSWQATIRRVPYPTQATVDQIRRADLPRAERLIEKLLRASY